MCKVCVTGELDDAIQSVHCCTAVSQSEQQWADHTAREEASAQRGEVGDAVPDLDGLRFSVRKSGAVPVLKIMNSI